MYLISNEHQIEGIFKNLLKRFIEVLSEAVAHMVKNLPAMWETWV